MDLRPVGCVQVGVSTMLDVPLLPSLPPFLGVIMLLNRQSSATVHRLEQAYNGVHNGCEQSMNNALFCVNNYLGTL